MDEIFRALADPSRRGLLDRLRAQNGQTLGELCARLDMTRQAVSKHLAILEEANLVATVWPGREKLHYLRPLLSLSEVLVDRVARPFKPGRHQGMFKDLRPAV